MKSFSTSFQAAQKDCLSCPRSVTYVDTSVTYVDTLCWEECRNLLGRQARLEYFHGICTCTAIHTNSRDQSEFKKKKASLWQLGAQGLLPASACWLLLMLWQFHVKSYSKACQKQDAPTFQTAASKKREGKKRRIKSIPHQRENMTTFSFRRKVVSMFIINKESLTSFVYLHHRILPVSLLGLGSLFSFFF